MARSEKKQILQEARKNKANLLTYYLILETRQRGKVYTPQLQER
jgi:hypothetical protein